MHYAIVDEQAIWGVGKSHQEAINDANGYHPADGGCCIIEITPAEFASVVDYGWDADQELQQDVMERAAREIYKQKIG